MGRMVFMSGTLPGFAAVVKLNSEGARRRFTVICISLRGPLGSM